MAKQKQGSDTFHVRIPDELRDAMLKQCEKDRTTISAQIKHALRFYLKYRDCEEAKLNVLKDDPKV